MSRNGLYYERPMRSKPWERVMTLAQLVDNIKLTYPALYEKFFMIDNFTGDNLHYFIVEIHFGKNRSDFDAGKIWWYICSNEKHHAWWLL